MQYFSSSIRNLSLWSSLNSSSTFLGSLLIMKGLVQCLWSHNRVLEDSALGMLRLSRSHSHRCSPLMLLRPTESSSGQRLASTRWRTNTSSSGSLPLLIRSFSFLILYFSLFALQTDRVLVLDSRLLAYASWQTNTSFGSGATNPFFLCGAKCETKKRNRIVL